MKSILITFFLYAAFILNLNAQDYLGSINQKDENGYTAGTISGSLSVSPGGAASYMVPIELPEGRMGMTPQLALSYSSQGEYGLLGKGWSLNGWSYIARTGKNLYYDNEQSSISFGDDSFTLDGARLIETSEYEQSNVIYRTETDMFAKIVHEGAEKLSGKDASLFKVYTKDGIVKTYGGTPNSRQVYHDNSYPAIRYHLNWVEDSKGNFIKYEYERIVENGELRLKWISYTGNSGVTGDAEKPFYIVEFVYNSAQLALDNSLTSFFNKGNDLYAYKVTSLLKEIKVSYSGSEIKKYEIGYKNEGNFSYPYLTEVKLHAGFEKMNPLTFTWNHPVNNIISPQYYRKDDFTVPASYDQNIYLNEDLNFDGKDEIIEVGNFGRRNGQNVSGTFIRLGNNYDIFFKISDYTGKDVHLIDFNGDGEKEIFIDGEVFNFYFGSGNQSVSLIKKLDRPVTSGEFKIKHVGDFNGDGIQDIIVKQLGSYNVYFGDANILMGYNTRYQIDNYSVVSDALACVEGDFIGKGTTNFCILKTSTSPSDLVIQTLELELLSGYNKYSFASKSTQNDLLNGLSQLDGFTSGDFNGDGKTDVLVSYKEEIITRTKILYSFGKGFEQQEISTPLFGMFSQGGFHRVVDINNDGISDIVFYRSIKVFEQSKWNYKLQMNKYIKKPGVSGGFVMNDVSIASKFILNQTYLEGIEDDGLLIGDFTGNGSYDCFRSFHFFNDVQPPIYAGRCSEIFSSNSGTPPIDAITQITDGFGKTDKIIYKKYIPGITDTKFPVTNFKQAFYVVDQIEADLGKTVPVQKYTYKNMLAHAQGKGLLGFEYTAVNDLINNTLSEVRNVVYNSSEQGDQFRPVVFLYPESSVVTYLDENLVTKKISESSSEITIKRTCENDLFNHFENLIHIPVVTLSINKNWDIDESSTYIGCNVQTQSVKDIDEYGNVTKSVSYADELKLTNFPGLESDYSWVEIVETNYLTPGPEDLENWIISRPEKIKATSKHHPRSGDCKQPESHFSVTNFIYYPKEHEHYPLLQFKKESPSGNADLETSAEFDYDDFGNVIKRTITTPEEPNTDRVKITEYTYNPDANYRGRFLTEEKVIAGSAGNDMITRYDYYLNTGALKSQTNINGLTTSFRYDAFGKKNLTTLPDGTSMISIIGWSKGMEDAPENALFCIAKGKQLANSSIIWNKEVVFFDKLQRALRSVSLNLSSKFVYSAKEYDEFGRLSRVSEPYFKTSEASLFTSYKYDRAGRNFATITPTGAIITTESKGRVTTVTNDATGNWSEKEVNIKGMPIRINDKTNGNIEFCYDAAGRETAVKKYGLLTTFTYDDFGNREKINDPDAGETVTIYNKQNQIDNSTDARRNRLEFKHDHLGRLWKRKNITDNDEVEYIYYANSNEVGFGNIKYIIKKDLSTGAEIHKTEFNYDNLRRISKRKEYIDNEIYTFVYNYNSSSGELEYYQYPTGYRIKYRYNNDGYMNMVEDVSTGLMLWNALDNNARGQLTDFSLGNGLYTQNQFDQYGFPRRITTTDFNKKQFIKPYSESPETAPDAIPETIQDNTHYFNIHNGNLMQKWDLYDENKWFCEKYEYDPVLNERLTKWYKYPGGVEYSINYSNSGNINNKTGITVPGGSYNYGSNAGPHAVTGITGATQDYIGANAHYMQNVSYNGINMPYYMHQLPQSGGFKMDRIRITYGNGDQRVKTEFSTVYEHYVETDTRYYFGDFEVEKKYNSSDKVYYHYLAGTNGVFAIMKWKGVEDLSIYYIHPDYLGSLQVISDEHGNKIEQMSFDPWGRRRNPADGTFTNLPATFLFMRGYTGHEHYDKFGLINMNARLYDPFLGRFLSPDPQVQAPGYGQNYNRYTYALNNPLKYTDPDGEFWHLVIGAAIGGTVNWLAHGAKFNAQGLKYFGVGALAGALAAGVGAGVSSALVQGGSFSAGFWGTAAAKTVAIGFQSGFAIGMSAGATNGFVSGFGNSLADGNKLIDAFGNGIKQAVIQGASGAIIGGVIGGTVASIKGNNFWTGVNSSKTFSNISERVLLESPINNAGLDVNYQSEISSLPEYDRAYITAERFLETDDCTISCFDLGDNSGTGYFLEPRGPSSVVSGSGQRIQEGVYELVNHNGARFQNVLRLTNVPGRSAILIHTGNYATDTSGCLLPGLTYGNNTVSNSRDALDMILAFFRRNAGRTVAIVIN